jgi:hypothetical protein
VVFLAELFEVRTENGGEEFIKFNQFHLFRKSWFIAYMPTVIFAAIGVMAYLDDDRSAAYTMWVIGAAMPLFLRLIIRITAKRNLKTNKMYTNMKNIYYRFDRQGLFSETASPKLKTTLETDWDNVYRVYESKDSFYIYISNMQAFIIPKVDIITGTPEELSQMMTELIGKKYYKR